MATSSIFHFTPPKHELVKTLKEESFKCKMCELPGSGTSYSCNPCDFHLHEHCSSCPPNITFFAHPMHELTLSNNSNMNFSRNKHCALCSDHVHGYSYRCDPCKFNVHLPCSLMPETVNKAELHQEHELRLVYFDQKKKCCSACGKGNRVAYLHSCEPCGVAYHPKCVHGDEGGGGHLLGKSNVIGEAILVALEITGEIISGLSCD